MAAAAPVVTPALPPLKALPCALMVRLMQPALVVLMPSAAVVIMPPSWRCMAAPVPPAPVPPAPSYALVFAVIWVPAGKTVLAMEEGPMRRHMGMLQQSLETSCKLSSVTHAPNMPGKIGGAANIVF